MEVLVNNIQDKIEISEGITLLLKKVGEYILRLEGAPSASELSIVLVDNNHIHELNLTYRGVDSSTDVLAFNLQNDIEDEPEEGKRILGDVIISLEKAQEQSRRWKHDISYELAFLATHGILHLLGYDHDTAGMEQEMKEKEEFILKRLLP